MMGKRKILTFLPLLIIILIIPIVVFLATSKGTRGFLTRAGGTREALLFLVPAEARISQGETADFSLKIDTGRVTAGGVEIVISYDPSLISLTDTIETGPAFPGLISEVSPGRILLRGQGRLYGQGTVTNLSFVGSSKGEANLEIAKSSVVLNESGVGDILQSASGAKVIIE